MLKMMKFDGKFPYSWPKQLFTIEKTKRCQIMQNTSGK